MKNVQDFDDRSPSPFVGRDQGRGHMKCQGIQQQLLTDFLDQELSSAKRLEIDGHLAQCACCREFLAAVKKVNDPLQASERVEPAAHVWLNIRDQIEAKPSPVIENIRSWFEEVLWGFRPTFVYGSLVAAMCVVLFVPVGLHHQQAVARADKEMLMQLVYADDNTTAAMGTETIGTGTVVEHWL